MHIICEVVSILVNGIVYLDLLVNTDEDIGDRHLVHGKGAGLVRADVVGASHNLARSKLLHEVLIDEHLSHRVSKGDHHCQGKTLGHGKIFLQVMEVRGKKRIKAKEVHLSIGKLLNEESKKKYVKCQQCCEHTQCSKILTDLVKLNLQRSLLIGVLLKLSLDLTIATVLSNNNSNKPTLTSCNLGT
jgi:hypothetical protein